MRYMYKQIILIVFSFILLANKCTDSQTGMSDKKYIEVVEKDLKEKMEAIGNDSIFPNFNDEKYSDDERNALKFLYAYMPLGDITDYPESFYLQNIQSSFQARKEMPWGDKIPEEVFRHFVLPIRVNNEALDSSRVVFYKELKDRVKGLSMYDAILEVNHWCHEKVTYQPSDQRTSSPLASVKTGFGRCGEESTFTVAALRSVGIPARQVYTPRWAHTDDNHAWVEAWADGKWHYLGACEPAPVLDMGWFDAPVKRALLLHTKVFGKYLGPEDIMQQTNTFAEINVTENYAPTARTTVQIVDSTGKAMKDAHVEFGIYNYSEFYPVFTAQTDENGKASITTGLGDISVWAHKDNKWTLQTVTAGKQELYTIKLQHNDGEVLSKEIDIVPPAEGKLEEKVTQAQIDENAMRLAKEDSIRNAYISTFIQDKDKVAFANKIKADATLVSKYLTLGRGNWQEIQKFLTHASESNKLDLAFRMLANLPEKDFRDTPAHILQEHLDNVVDNNNEIFNKYVLNPRVDFEMLTPYIVQLQKNIPADIQQQARKNPNFLVEWVKKIKILDEYNPQHIIMSPMGVLKLGASDTNSRNIFFVAAARSLGIPARLEEVTGKLQYYFENNWIDVHFNSSEVKPAAPKGIVKLNYQPSAVLENPLYDSNFTIAKLQNGTMNRLNFTNTEGTEGAVSWESLFKKPVELEVGDYMLITGTRMASGKVLSQIKTFHIDKNKTTPVELTFRKDDQDIQVLGNINPEALFTPSTNGDKTTILNTTGRGYFIVAILGAGQEPSNHFVRDLIARKTDFEKWNRKVLLLFPNAQHLQNFQKSPLGTLPSTVVLGVDNDLTIAKELAGNLNLNGTNNLPIVVIGDTFGRVVFVSNGYSIGLGDRLIQTVKKL